MDREKALAILGAAKRVYGSIPVPEWKTGDEIPNVRIRVWNSMDLASFEIETSFLKKHLGNEEVDKLLYARVAAWCWVDDTGELICELPKTSRLKDAAKDKEVEAAIRVYYSLAEHPATALLRIYNAASGVNAMSESDEIELEKN